jgi:hypothetical protein
MSTLAELVKFRNDLRATLSQLSMDNEVADRLRLVDTIRCRHSLPQYDHYINQFVSEYRQLLDKNNSIVDLIKQSITAIEADIQQQVDALDFSLFTEENMKHFLSTTSKIENTIQHRIGAYSDWHVPGLQLHCRYIGHLTKNYKTANFRTNVMAACDPLYLVSHDKNKLQDIIADGYAEEYRRRVRIYEIANRDLSVLPQAQFGLILCWDFLNYLPLDAVKWYLDACIRLLRPGGTLIFSYNNCDIERSAQLVDDQQACWATKTLIENLATSLGYELITTTDLRTNNKLTTWVSWAEVRKPGAVTTVKRSQAMGAILSK